MKKNMGHDMLPVFEICYLAFGAAGMLILADRLFRFGWPPALLVMLALVFQALLRRACGRGDHFRVWGGLLALNLLVGYVMYKAQAEPETALYYLGIEAACLTAGAFYYLAGRRFWLKAGLFVVQAVLLVFFALRGITLSKWAVCMILLCLLLFLTELCGRNRTPEAGRNALSLFPVFLAVSCLLLLCPAQKTPIRWTVVRRAAAAVREKAEAVIADVKYRFSGKDTYEMSFAGYGADGKLGGGIASSDKVWLILSEGFTESPLYLTGSVYDGYTGQGWEKETEEAGETDSRYQGQYERLSEALSRSVYTPEEIREFAQDRGCKVEYAGIKTKSLFRAPNTEKITLLSEADVVRGEGGYVLNREGGVGFTYGMRFLEIDYANEKMQRLMRGQAWKQTPGAEGISVTGEKVIHERYTRLPRELPARVRRLAREITREADTDYDRVKAIESYLKDFQYTLTPGACPEGRDVTDYFLFDSQKGYCTYFATAMVVLARCQGIPARYAEGFVTKEAYDGVSKSVEITGGDAHAWAEIYISGIGFIPFEATPGYTKAVNTAWKQPELPADRVEYRLSAAGAPAAEPDAAGGREEKESLRQRAEGIAGVLLEAAAVLGICAAAGFCLSGLRRAVRDRRYRSLSACEKLWFQMERIFLIGALSGLKREEGETLEDYGIRTCGCLDTAVMSFAQVCRLFQGVRFGGIPISEGDLERIEGYFTCLEKQYLSGCGRIGKLLYHLR